MGLADTLGGLLGGDAGKDEMEKSLGLSREAMETLKNVYVPTTSEQEILLSNPELAGLLEAEQLQDSRLSGVQVDPRLRQAQMRALEEISGLAETGMGAEDRAALNSLLRSTSGQAQAEQASVLQDANARGTLDSGATLMAELNAGQNQANRAQDEAMKVAANAMAARREALNSKANLSTTMGQNDFNQKAQIANSQDAISKFNSQNRQDVNAQNLNARQTIMNAATNNKNAQEMHNKGLIQQKFQNELSKAGGVSGATQNMANNYAQQGQAAAQGQAGMTSGLLNAGAQIGAAYATGGASELASDDATKKK